MDDTRLTLMPAYGRDYKSKQEVLADWNAGKDFRIATASGYINKEDAIKGSVKEVNIRYRGLRQVAVIKQNRNGEWK